MFIFLKIMPFLEKNMQMVEAEDLEAESMLFIIVKESRCNVYREKFGFKLFKWKYTVYYYHDFDVL